MSADEQTSPARTKAILVDPATMTVVWMNDQAARALPDQHVGAAPGVPIEQVVPMAESLGVRDAVRGVADSGMPRHLRTDLVSTSRGTVTIVISIDRLPSGEVLVLTENAWQAGRDVPGGSGRRVHGEDGGSAGTD